MALGAAEEAGLFDQSEEESESECSETQSDENGWSDDVVLSAASDHPSNAKEWLSAMRVHSSMLQVIGVRKPVSRLLLLRGDCSDQQDRKSVV